MCLLSYAFNKIFVKYALIKRGKCFNKINARYRDIYKIDDIY